jgi:hypothetical protein
MSREIQAQRSTQLSDGMTLDSESNWPCNGALQASSGIAMGVLLGAGTWLVVGGFAFVVINFKTLIS